MNRAQPRHGVCQRNAGSDRKSAVGALADIVQPNNPAEPNHALQVAQLLGDPETDIGRPADEGRIGKARIERSERIEARRGGEEGRLVADEHVLMVSEGGERRGALLRRRGETVGGLTDRRSAAPLR